MDRKKNEPPVYAGITENSLGRMDSFKDADTFENTLTFYNILTTNTVRTYKIR